MLLFTNPFSSSCSPSPSSSSYFSLISSCENKAAPLFWSLGLLPNNDPLSFCCEKIFGLGLRKILFWLDLPKMFYGAGWEAEILPYSFDWDFANILLFFNDYANKLFSEFEAYYFISFSWFSLTGAFLLNKLVYCFGWLKMLLFVFGVPNRPPVCWGGFC